MRRGRDSNPRSLAAQRFSRPPQSTTLPPLRAQKYNKNLNLPNKKQNIFENFVIYPASNNLTVYNSAIYIIAKSKYAIKELTQQAIPPAKQETEVPNRRTSCVGSYVGIAAWQSMLRQHRPQRREATAISPGFATSPSLQRVCPKDRERNIRPKVAQDILQTDS